MQFARDAHLKLNKGECVRAALIMIFVTYFMTFLRLNKKKCAQRQQQEKLFIENYIIF